MQAADVMVVEDDADLREALGETLEAAGFDVELAAEGTAALVRLAARPARLVLTDMQMAPMDGPALLAALRTQHPGLPVVVMTAYGTIEQAVAAMRAGAADYLVKPFESAPLLEVVRRHLPPAVSGHELAHDTRSIALYELAWRVAGSDATVLITGESGTGKEVLARALHARSPRAAAPFVAINCAAIPEQMLEATLFGHEKGAFTGALSAHPGKFEQAQGGTLLLDEISEMPLPLQAKLLRVLQEREVERIGSKRAIALDVRVLATSNRRLRDEVAAGRFREDLYFRLNVFPLHVPALRQRPGDVLPLARQLLARHCRGRPLPVLTAAAAARLQAYAWPGNVRELENAMQRALVLCAGREIDADALVLDESAEAAPPTAVSCGALDDSRRRNEQSVILEALRAGNGSRRAAAVRLGISERTLRYKLAQMRAVGIRLPPVGTACA